jgi:type IV secretion system protein VirD4
MEAIETAAGYMASFGIQLWAVLQDLTQLQTHYKTSWETFLGNAGVINAFSVVDATTTKYLSSLLGNTTILEARHTRLNSQGVLGGDPGFESVPRAVPLMEPAEITQHFARGTERQIVLMAGQSPSPIHMQRFPLEDSK